MMMHFLLAVALAFAGGDDTARVQAVGDALGQAEPRLHRCWEQAAAADWQVEGNVTVRAQVGPGGRILRVELDGHLPTPELEACVREVFSGLTIGDAFAPGDSIELPLELKAEPNVTLKQKDAPALKIAGSMALARILVDEKTSGATRASLTFVEIPAGGRWMRPNTSGTAVIFVNKGRAKIGKGEAVTNGDAAVFADGSAWPFMASLRTELLVLLVPPGGEQAYRDGAVVAAAGTGPEPKIFKRLSAKKLNILDGKSEALLLVENEAASVTHLKLYTGVTVPEHVHAKEAEILWITTGTGEMTVDGDKYPVEPFMAIHIPPGAKHSFTASPQSVPVEAIQFYAPSGPEQRFKGPK